MSHRTRFYHLEPLFSFEPGVEAGLYRIAIGGSPRIGGA
jgi:hypothetical protein